MDRPTLLPHLSALWRDRTTLQLGIDPDRAVVVEFTDPAATRIVGLLDGTRTERAVYADATALGIPAEQVTPALTALREAGVLVGMQALLPSRLSEERRRWLASEAAALALRQPPGPEPRATSSQPGQPSWDGPAPAVHVSSGAPSPQGGPSPEGRSSPQSGPRPTAGASAAHPGPPDPVRVPPPTPAQILRRRAAANILVTGHGRLAAPIAAALAASGVGHVAAQIFGTVRTDDTAVGGLLPADCDRSAAEAATAAIVRAAPGVNTAPMVPASASFVVRVGPERTPATLVAQAYARRRIPHLAVMVRDGAVVVGPLVPPAGSPCLACLDLHRADRDPAWGRLVAQLATQRPPAQACAATTVLIGAGYAAAEVLAYLDGDAVRTRGVTVEIAGTGEPRRRSWTPHPRCRCHQSRRSSRRR